MEMKTLAINLKYRLAWRLRHIRLQLLKRYADFRVGATIAEKHAYKTSPSILLTFDDYGSPVQVQRVLQILASEQVRAMFFLQGDWAGRRPQLVQAIAAGGHIIGNHTYSHPDLLSLSDQEVESQISRGPHSRWLRPPQGRYNRRVREIAHRLGYRICYWTIDSDDWQGVSPEQISRKVLAELHPGAVILFHLHADHTIRVLPQLISAIRARGYELHSPAEPLWEATS
jgi:peptidoglycan/xylan/chitin deacetylase (PgdA/CDA1 family)